MLPHEAAVRDLPLAILAGRAAVVGLALVYWRADRIAEWELHVALVGRHG